MKKISTVTLYLFVLLLSIASVTFISTSAKANDPIPADGCKYTGDWTDFCKFGQYQIFNCVNTIMPTTCGFDVPIPPTP